MAVLNQYSPIVSGLTYQGSNASRPTVFYLNDDLYLYNGGLANAWKWNVNLATWEIDSLVSTFDVSPGTYKGPCAFYFNSELHLILCGNSGLPTGYKWSENNNRWESFPAIVAGITSGSFLHPTVFNINTTTYLILGNSAGTFDGYIWNGSQWVSDSDIVLGLVDAGSYTRPTTFFYNSELYLVSSKNNSYKWTGTEWIANSLAVNIDSQTAYPSLTSFELNGFLYIINGSSGNFKGYRLEETAKIVSVTAEEGTNLKAKLTVKLSEPLGLGETLIAYNAPRAADLGNPLFEVALTQDNDLTWSYQTDIKETERCNFRAVQLWNETELDTADFADSYYYILAPISPTIINITNPDNYRILDSPSHNYNHGSLFYNGYVYGSARNYPNLGDSDIFKLQASDYSNLLQKTIYLNKNAQTNRLSNFDQIVYHKNFLWIHRNQYLVRLNPSDLDYIIFSGLPSSSQGQPLGADSNNLYLFDANSASKINTDLLLDSFLNYGYDGTEPIQAPLNTILATCNIIQYHPINTVYNHSTVIDSQYLYLNCSQTSNPYDSDLDLDTCHFQKIRKSDMVTVGDVKIPQSTDDMVHNGDYVFLAPEINSYFGNENQLGYGWGLTAVNKKTLQIKHLNGLWPGDSNSFRDCFGVFYFNDKIAVQQKATKATIILDISNIENWGDHLPLGSETEAIYTFQLNGVDLVAACNELVLDNAGWAHTNTWEDDTIVLKFPITEIPTLVKEPIIQTSLISSSSDNATIGGYVIDEGMSPITDVGFRYGTDPELLNINVDVSPDTYDFQTLLESLLPAIYYIQAWGVNTEGTWYGNTVVFTTYNEFSLSNENDDVLLEWVNENYGCSIRCVQDAPGVADGVTGTATDQNGNTYNTIVINQKRWFVENLKTTTYRDGTAIPEVTSNSAWAALTDGGRCSYNNE